MVFVTEPNRPVSHAMDGARAYLESHDVQADFLERSGQSADSILAAASDWQADLVILGGYGYSPVFEAILGSTVDRLLREGRQPMLICR